MSLDHLKIFFELQAALVVAAAANLVFEAIEKRPKTRKIDDDRDRAEANERAEQREKDDGKFVKIASKNAAFLPCDARRAPLAARRSPPIERDSRRHNEDGDQQRERAASAIHCASAAASRRPHARSSLVHAVMSEQVAGGVVASCARPSAARSRARARA